MDSVTVVSIIEGSISLIVRCSGVVSSLKDLASKFKQTKLTLLSMIQEVDTIESAWSRIKDWSQVHAGAMTDLKFTERLAQSLEYNHVGFARRSF